MFIHTRGSAIKRFAKFKWQKRTFCGRKEEKAVSPIRQTIGGCNTNVRTGREKSYRTKPPSIIK